jgi:D-serine deaminase-like pyridoxal phosphate-dependent protein
MCLRDCVPAKRADHSLHRLADVPTPALILDRKVLQQNIDDMAARTRAISLELRPHLKTHKSIEIARLQRSAGASGFTVATVNEAEVFASAGFDNLLLASPPVGKWRIDRLLDLARNSNLSVTLDSTTALLALDEASHKRGINLSFLWEIDSGVGRFGTLPGGPTASEIAEALPRLRSCTFAGLMTFGGRGYAVGSEAELERSAQGERDAISETVDALAAHGIDVRLGSIGSTPHASKLAPARGITETRPGNYVFNDATQVALGVADESRCALSVLTTVLARPTSERAIFDAGSKALASDHLTPRTTDFGFVLGQPQIRLQRLFEEHAIAAIPADIALDIGDRVRVVPNHSCASTNLHSQFLVVEDGNFIDVWPVDARGF